jgi:ribosomal protein S18 acetylase RimI-like enzyme
MNERFINITLNNIEDEHLCCAISDKKHQDGVHAKKDWLKKQIPKGHIFRKLDVKGKVFIEYSPLESSWVPIAGSNYLYIYCLWVSGKYKGQGHAKSLLEYCIDDAKKQGKSGICVLSSKKKKPFLSDKKFMQKYGFEVVDNVGDYELLALSFDGTKPSFNDGLNLCEIESNDLTIYYGNQCPYIPNCINQIKSYCESNNVPLNLIPVDTLERAKSVPCIFNNWAVFYRGNFETVHLLNERSLKKLIEI